MLLLIMMMRFVARVVTRNVDRPRASSDDGEEGLPSVLGTIADMGAAAQGSALFRLDMLLLWKCKQGFG